MAVTFDPDTFEQPILGFAYNGASKKDVFHSHRSGQLLYSVRGVIEVQVGQQLLIVPPTNALWVPPDVMHCSVSTKPIHFRSLFINSQYCDSLSTDSGVIFVSALLKALIERVCAMGVYAKQDPSALDLTRVILNEMLHASLCSFKVDFSSNELILQIYDYLKMSHHWALSSDAVASEFGMSTKTMNRFFQKETGMTYHQWFTQVKLVLAMAWLSEGVTITKVAHDLSYSSDSAFIAQFKRYFGITPGQFIKQRL